MKTSKNGLELIKKFEGFSAKVYDCPGGLPTIGYGHQILPKERFTTITEEEAEKLLITDILSKESFINKVVKVPINQNQFDALVSFVYNLGEGSFFSSTLLKRLNNEDYDVGGEFIKWRFATTVVNRVKTKKELPGLKARREAEKQLWEK